MARQYVPASSEYDSYADSAAIDVGAGDFSICAWLRRDSNDNSSGRFFCKGNSSGGTANGVRYEAFYNGGSTLTCTIDDNSTKVDTNWTGMSAGAWYAVIFERDSGTNCKIFNGSTEVAASGSDGAGNIDNGVSLVIGAGRSSSDTIDSFIDCSVAEFAIVKRLLTSGEKAAFGNGVSPIFFRPSFYVPFVRVPNDLYGSVPTVGGTPDVITHSHSPMRYPTSQILQFPPAAAPAAGPGRLSPASLGMGMRRYVEIFGSGQS